ncbi:MAG: hypothetical protein OEZ38_06170, partial [Gammaproteobacteria bacterium]|nr:hypothetical protein [Gammaproteobacteria bacterium]
TPEMIYEWLHRYKDCLPAPSAYVQSPDQVTENLDQRLKQLHAVADALYGWWLGHVSRGINWD